MGGVGVWAMTLCIIFLSHPCSAYLPIRHCQVHQDCYPGEYCKDQQGCTCQRDFVREPGGACLALRRAGEPCLIDQQCSNLDHRLLCYHDRCGCPNGLTRADGTCVSAITPATPVFTLPPTGAAPASLARKPTMTRGTGGSVAQPIIICLVIFISFCIMMIVITYSFRARSRRLAVRTTYREVIAADLSNGSFTDLSSDTNLGDIPLDYRATVPLPPSYKQSILRPTTLSSSSTIPIISSRYSSCTASIETVPRTFSSPDTASSVSYGSLLTRSLLLTPDIAPSITDLTTASVYDSRIPSYHERY
nr:uncharacterized protein LOC128703893 [Cherax quadricarinatus]